LKGFKNRSMTGSMSDITEQQIERFIRYPEELSRQEREQVQSALNRSEELQELADFFRSYYEELDRLSQQKRAKRNPVVELEPLEITPGSIATPHLKLAAMSEAPTSGELQTVVTLASEPEETVIRILENESSGEYQVHAISNKIKAGEFPLLSIDEYNMDLVIDDCGHLVFEPDQSIRESNWKTLGTFLRLPIDNKTVDFASNENSEPISYRSGLYKLTVQRKKNELQGTIKKLSTRFPSVTRVLVVGPNTGKHLIRVTEMEFSCSVDKNDRELDIWLYL